MIDRLISELIKENHDRIKGINHNYIFDPIKRNIINAIEYLHSKGHPTTSGYIIDLFEKTKKGSTIEIRKILSECEKITIPFIGETNEVLRKEYMKLTLDSLKVEIDSPHKNEEIKIKNIQDRLKVLIDETCSKYEFSLKEEMEEYNKNYGTVSQDKKGLPVYLKHHQLLFGERMRPFFYCIAARPGKGKTTLLRDIEADWIRRGHRGLAFSLEDNKDTFTEKVMATYYGVTKRELEYQNVHNKKKLELMKLQKPEGDIIIVDKFVDRSELRVICEKYAGKVDWISLDYLQIIDKQGGKTHEEIGLFTKEIMRICKELKVPFIALTQLNRDGEKENREPVLADLKDSGSIEQDARFVVALWDENASVLKNTWGQLITHRVEFDMAMGRMLGVSKYTPPENKNGRYKK